MKRIDPNQELLHMVALMNLRQGESVFDAQTEPDLLLRFVHDRVGDRGRCVGAAFGQGTVEKVTEQFDRWELPNVKLLVAHPATITNMKPEIFSGVVLRHTYGVPRLAPVFANLDRISKPGARIVVRHTEWSVTLPKATAEEQAMLDALKAPGVVSGQEFFKQFSASRPRGWRDVRYEVYTVGSRDPRAFMRHPYDWRTMLRDHLTRARVFTPRQILDLISRLEDTRGAKVTVERYLALGVKP